GIARPAASAARGAGLRPAGAGGGQGRVRIAVDALGGDRGPAEVIAGALVAACRAVGAGEADAVVSAGNTGAMLAAGLLHIRRLPGVARPAIAVVIPA